MAKRKSLFRESLLQNMHSYYYYLDVLTEIALSRFEWVNLPLEIDERYLEETLFRNGTAVFFQDEVVDKYMALSMIQSGRFDVYGKPVIRRAYSMYNNYQRMLKASNSVIIYNNMIRNNTFPLVEYYARRLYFYDRIMDVNVNTQKTPILLQTDEKQKLSLINIYKQWDGNEPVITAYNSFDPDSLKVLKTDSPFVADKIFMLKTDIWNECMGFLGVSNVQVEKRERVIRDEVTRSLGGTLANRWAYLKARKYACREINRMFGLELDIKWNENEGLGGGFLDGGFYNSVENDSGIQSGLPDSTTSLEN